MNTELAPRLVEEIKNKFPALNLTAEEICQITMITLSTIAGFWRERIAFSSARLLRYARDSVKSLIESD